MKVLLFRIRRGVDKADACLTLYRSIHDERRINPDYIVKKIEGLTAATAFIIHPEMLSEVRRCFEMEVESSELCGSMSARNAAWESLHHVKRDRLLLHLLKAGLLRIKEGEDVWTI